MEKLKSGAEKLGFHLSPEQLEQFETYYKELTDWNRKLNLTSITDYEEVQVKHFLDSLTVTLAIKQEDFSKRLSVIDVGSGAGLPGIPLKILLPAIRLTLLEATAKKAKFLEHLIEKLGLDDIEIVVGRAEEAAHKPQYREKFDLVLSRAVASLPTLVELTLPLCAVGGIVVAQKKGGIVGEVEQSHKAIAMLGGKPRGVKAIELTEFSDRRCLVMIDKIQSTPREYPRRSGMPAKRPIIS
jgi:16S rRNA (guanine527-N7)-methyltransferase